MHIQSLAQSLWKNLSRNRKIAQKEPERYSVQSQGCFSATD